MKRSRLKQSLPFKLTHAALSRFTKSSCAQHFLEKLIPYLQSHLGIGGGSHVSSSGERVVFKKLLELPRLGSAPLCIFDVGSNQGQFLRLIEENIAVPHQVHCFEPSRYTFGILQKSASSWSHVTLNNLGLGKAAGEFDLFSDEDGSGLASLSQRRLEHHGIDFSRRERVRLETLDSYCAGHDIERIDLLKLDVEGHELDVLEGGKRMFAEGRVQALMFEFGGCNIDSRTFFRDFYHFFQAHGMGSIFRILPTCDLQPVGRYTETLEQFATTNFLVLKG